MSPRAMHSSAEIWIFGGPHSLMNADAPSPTHLRCIPDSTTVRLLRPIFPRRSSPVSPAAVFSPHRQTDFRSLLILRVRRNHRRLRPESSLAVILSRLTPLSPASALASVDVGAPYPRSVRRLRKRLPMQRSMDRWPRNIGAFP